MSDWPLVNGNTQFEVIGINTSTSAATPLSITAINTKSAWVEITSATTINTNFLSFITTGHTSSTGTSDALFDIAIGSAGNERIIIENLIMSVTSSVYRYHASREFPVKIPKGSRVSVRVQSDYLSFSTNVACLLQDNTFINNSDIDLWTTYGADTADSGGTSIDPGAVANTKGSYSELSASTPYDITNLFIGIGNKSDDNRNSQRHLIDISVGSTGNEVPIISNISLAAHSTGDIIGPPYLGPYKVHIPKGSRLSVRSQSDYTSTGDRTFDIILYGGS